MDAGYEETEVKIITEEVESCYAFMEVSSPKRRRKSKNQGDHADKSKKPRSAYLLYYFDIHQSMQQEYPDLPQSEINKRISESWKRLNVADKGYYLERAKLERDGIDPSSQGAGTSTDVPGFRKILPRANYVLLPKGGIPEEDRVSGPVEVCMETIEPLGEGLSVGGQPVSHETLLSLGSEVELSEQCIAIEGLTDETAAVLSRPGALQEILSQCSSSAAQDKQPAGFLVKEEPTETGDAYSAVGMLMEEGGVSSQVVQHIKEDATHLVTIVPNQELVESKIPSTTSSLVMVPVTSSQEPDPKPSLKLSIKYTRRGRGSCHTPGCSFSYVTRHKPPYCPDCGQHLGGKWVPTAKKVQAKAAAVTAKSSPRKLLRNPSHPGTTHPEPVTQLIVKSTSLGGDRLQWKEVAVTDSQQLAAPCAPLDRSAGVQRPSQDPTEIKKDPRLISVCKVPAGGSVDLVLPTVVSKAPTIEKSMAPFSSVRARTREKSSVLGPKRRVRAILPAPTTAGPGSRTTFVQWVTVPPEKVKEIAVSKLNVKTANPSLEKVSGLKPSTLKQLGHAVKPVHQEQTPHGMTNTSQYIVTDKGLKILSVVSFKSTASTLDLGLSTARGRGKCKNPACDYVYKNRHKPPVCPTCGWELSKKDSKKPGLTSGSEPDSAGFLDPYRPLSPAQKETQRQSTLQLLRRSIQLPESEAELQEVMALIQELNSAQVVLSGTEGESGISLAVEQSGWPRFYESAAQECALCHFPLFKGGQSSVAGQEDCWLLTDSHIQTATIQLKICLNPQCLALHSFCDIHPGLFNVGNKLLVSLDLLFKIRSQIKAGHDPNEAALMVLNSVQNQPVHTLNSKEVSHIQELLCSGYWAFECLTLRDYNDMICGVCGIVPKVEMAQRNASNVLQLKNVEFTWPDFQAADEVNVDDFWLTMESEAIEQAAFPSSIPITKFDASIIAPFFPPLIRNSVVINTEKDKNVFDVAPAGDPSALVRQIHEGALKPEQIQGHSMEELRVVLERCGIPCGPESSKGQMMGLVCALYAHVQNGFVSSPQPPPHLTAGKLYKMCPHQVVCGSKYMVRGETARDHVDLLVSSRHWPPVYVTDCARQVALCTDVHYPDLAWQMWGKNQGCFSDPMGELEYVSCAELQDQQYSMDLSGVESSPVHPITKSSSRWIVHPGEAGDGAPELRHHSMVLCQELEPYQKLAAAQQECETDGGVTSVRRRPLVFDNAAYYYLYNRLIDFLTSRDIVNQQISDVLQGCQPGEVVIRDTLYRLGVAQINTEVDPGTEPEETIVS
ncbi:HMG domain-containing protein 3 isoform X2 [Scleropages formosus]|uniref:HMG domain-containing protein 3 isoform X2 n=1 Tax=Scleropages formosus TaxID=113540 RepID=UPI000878AC6B|nr:HMG domain-containing protein 3 isoform X2 [Scleropages formosus]